MASLLLRQPHVAATSVGVQRRWDGDPRVPVDFAQAPVWLTGRCGRSCAPAPSTRSLDALVSSDLRGRSVRPARVACASRRSIWQRSSRWSPKRPGGSHEADIPTEQPETGKEARVSGTHVRSGRSCRAPGPAGQGSSPALGLIWSIRERASFERVASGNVVTCPYYSVRYVLDVSLPAPKVAFATSTSMGAAPARNLVRRRLRAIIRNLEPPAGIYLVRVRDQAVTASFAELRDAWALSRGRFTLP